MKMPQTSSIMFHTVGVPFPGWTWRFLTVPRQLFEGMLRMLKRMGYRSVFLEEYQDIFLKGRLGKERVVSLTFDDGYLDNWVYASVLLEKYGFCGTVFVSGDFIDPSLAPRPRWGGEPDSPELPADGFLNAGELRELERRGIMEAQSHCMTHTWYPNGPRIVDFRHPGDTYHWMDWNASPESKARQVQPGEDASRFGEPVYEHQKSLNGPRFFPDPAVAEQVREYAASKGEGFFRTAGWREELMSRAAEARREASAGVYETEEAFMERARFELGEPQRVLGALLDKKVRYLCWPGGGYSGEVFSLAAEYYSGTTISSSFGGTRKQGLDGSGCFRFSRFGPLHIGEGNDLRYLGPLTNSLYIEERRSGFFPCRLVRGGLSRLARWGLL